MPPVPLRAMRLGALAALPLQLATVPFGMIFGALAIRAGLGLSETMAMTSIVVAGASQLAALQLMGDQAPAALAILAGAVVNLRMAMYSASIAAHWRGAPLWSRVCAAFFLHDQAYVLSMRRYHDHPDEPLEHKVGFFLGVGVFTIAVWIAACLAGALVGAQAPEAWGLSFAAPITFIAIVAPFLRTPAHMASASVAGLCALLFSGLPVGLGLVAGATAGIAAGAGLERLGARGA